ncbi:MAG: hypothetical protein EPO30_04680 [Lysobacteraceae bacterium]|nr:MAG: hypothetical protein EPO30_04680 [Xanthomonadaceae bacterium]
MIAEPTQLWQQIGKTLWHVQLAEFSLVNFYVAGRLDKDPQQVDLDDLLERNFKSTVGVIVGNLRQAGMLNPAIDSQLANFVSERNWLAHHVRRLHNRDIYNQDRYVALLSRLDALKSESDAISVGVTHWMDGWAIAQGLTVEELEQETQAQLASLRGEA